MSVNPAIRKEHNKALIIKAVVITVLVLLLAGAIYFFSKDQMLAGMVLLALPFPLLYLVWVFSSPRLGFISLLFANYFVVGLGRYIPVPTGLMVDALLLLTLLAVFLSQFNQKIEWKNAVRDYTMLALIWMIMTAFQLLNPEAVSRAAWFYAMRSQAFYMLLTIILVYLVFNKARDLDLFIKLTAWFTVLAVSKGLIQKYIGVDSWEYQWLLVPGNRTTHLLAGQHLRVFSFFADAGTYGSSMAYAGVVFTVLGLHAETRKKQVFYLLVALGGIFGMVISGTRSAVAVLLMGYMLYTLLSKRFKTMVSMGVFLLLAFIFLKYTTIGQSNYDIRRMRSVFNREDASLNVRLDNRRLFREYLSDKPFGGGVGSSGNWGLRFTPDTFLAKVPTDGWYVQLWVEQGIVGLSFYLLLLFYFLFKSVFLIFFRLKKPENRFRAIAFVSGMSGLMVSSYSAASLGQLPNTIIVVTSMALISMMTDWEKKELAEQAESPQSPEYPGYPDPGR
ncbi:MAG: O-antigen ligase family protein [Bacteroidales bacterium]